MRLIACRLRVLPIRVPLGKSPDSDALRSHAATQVPLTTTEPHRQSVSAIWLVSPPAVRCSWLQRCVGLRLVNSLIKAEYSLLTIQPASGIVSASACTRSLDRSSRATPAYGRCVARPSQFAGPVRHPGQRVRDWESHTTAVARYREWITSRQQAELLAEAR